MVNVRPSMEKKALSSGSLRTMSEKMRPRMTHSPSSSTVAGRRYSFWSVRSEQRSKTLAASAMIWMPSNTGMVERTGNALLTDRMPSFKTFESTQNLIYMTSLYVRIARSVGFLNP